MSNVIQFPNPKLDPKTEKAIKANRPFIEACAVVNAALSKADLPRCPLEDFPLHEPAYWEDRT